MDLFESLEKQYAENLPFVIYKKANSTKAIGIFQENNHIYPVHTFEESGFVFAPFHKGQRFYIPLDKSFVKDLELDFSKDIGQNKNNAILHDQGQLNFENLVESCVDAIKKAEFLKVVPSRRQSVQTKVGSLSELFKRLYKAYPTAFCSLMYHPEIGLWCGATPESLLSIDNCTLHTMSLAGTQVNLGQKEVVWPEKEKQEQQFVTDFIIEALRPFSNDVQSSMPYTRNAARVMHICTDIEAKLKEKDLKAIVEALHPTPAVCGLPKKPALDFLLNKEGYDREYYAGYLGELNVDFYQKQVTTDLYVNLRCMSIKENTVNLYIGCGVTKDSNPTLEFLETVNKSSTMKKILN